MPLGPLGAAWRQRLEAQANQPPAQPRLPLRWQGREIGSVAPALLAEPGLTARLPSGCLLLGGDACDVAGQDLSASLHQVALALRDAGLMKAWRNEQLEVADASGQVLGTVERGATRLLGVATSAVHLAGWSAEGGFWLQQRAFDKPTDPGLWDTLVGGMIPAGETLQAALARETAEEAGLVLSDLRDVRPGGCITIRRPAAEVRYGQVVERLHWLTCEVPAGLVPVNQDGEVAQFRCMGAEEVAGLLLADAFAADAALILLAACSAA